ncbi:MAG: SEC-C metal-binding domain-containing protein, partial [Phenylobacterium sp.]|uniref:preprotein translocase subunit SecA n=1 Tax=Phenylobacterium sp. TaxID=1871053 RepID=UPI0027362185
TGTASTEAQEFLDIYKMDVAEIPTNRPVARIDDDDEVYRTSAEKNAAILQQIEACFIKGQPILVGTVSIEKSEQLSEMLKVHVFEHEGKTVTGIPHNVLNARYHEQEALIVADAGVPGAVTIATNMAGRGTDIQLGGNIDLKVLKWRDEQRALGIEVTPEMAAAHRQELDAQTAVLKERSLAAGGLFVLGTERHESRRIDNQLRGRTGRQGDPGHSKFFLSCEDDLLRIFAGDRLDSIMRTFGVQEGEAITHKWLNSAIATAQKRVEQRNYEIRKNLLKYDDVVNDQRKAVFEQRQEFMEASDLSEIIREMRVDTIEDFVARHLPPKAYAEQWDVEGLDDHVQQYLGLELPIREWAAEDGIANEEIHERISAAAEARAAERESSIGDHMRTIEKSFLLQMIDLQWREHLMHLDHLRNVIGLRGYGQRDPLNEYKTEAFSLFEKLLVDLRQNVTRWLLTVTFEFSEPEPLATSLGAFTEVHMDPLTGENAAQMGALPDGLSVDQREALPISALPDGWEATGRNAGCPCGSGKKFKHCHGALV